MYTEKTKTFHMFSNSFYCLVSVIAATTTTAEVTAFHTLLLYVVYITMLAVFLSIPEIAIFVFVSSFYKEKQDYDKFLKIGQIDEGSYINRYEHFFLYGRKLRDQPNKKLTFDKDDKFCYDAL